MAFTQIQIQRAKQIQDAAAQDLTPTVRLVAGPGSGKSFVIEARVLWLLSTRNIPADNIIAVSFTRAAAKDLRERIVTHCVANGQPSVTEVRVSTLHALALRMLRQTGNLSIYPTDPRIMDDWELKEIFDAEFAKITRQTPTRCGEVRMDHEAFWSTGLWNPANYPQLRNPITQQERLTFQNFYQPVTQTYASVLPGEIVRTCVTQIQRGLIDPVQILGVSHLIVDEVQDLNPSDIEFINLLIHRGVNVFIAGDDDQSVYSFRYAYPQGIQNFMITHPQSANHALTDCFRCTPSVLSCAQSLISNFAAQNRIPKNLTSAYSSSNPVNQGVVMASIFASGFDEATYISQSCAALMGAGIAPRDIMILLGNKRSLKRLITSQLDIQGIAYDASEKHPFKDSSHGRFLQSILRIIVDTDDYIAHRVLLCTQRGVGVGTCHNITQKVIANNLNYRSIFYNAIPNGVFSTREVSAISRAAATISAFANWPITDTVQQHQNDLDNFIVSEFDAGAVTEWNQFIQNLPIGVTLQELAEYMQTDILEEQEHLIERINDRLGNQAAPAPVATNKVRIMTFHSSKGLSSKVVFIPGLEEEVFPNNRSRQSPGLILESARLLYVATTRAKSTCIFSFAQNRLINGTPTRMAPSRFCGAIGIGFTQQRNNSLTVAEIGTIVASISNL